MSAHDNTPRVTGLASISPVADITKALGLTNVFGGNNQDPGELNTQQMLGPSNLNCVECQGKTSHLLGIVCANYGKKRGAFEPCHQAWHARCFVIPKPDPFPRRLQPKSKELVGDKDEEEADGWEMSSGERETFELEYNQARAGDHLLTAFQCDICHFRNIQGRDPLLQRHQDRSLMLCIRRASLDAFWGSRPGTVAGHLKEFKTFTRISEELGIDQPFRSHPRGPYPLEDSVGMVAAVAMLQRSFHPGRNSTTVQWATCRKIRSCVSNIIHTSPMGSGLASMTDGQKVSHFTASPTNHVWFQSFAKGCKNRMGEVILQDQALSIDDLLALLNSLDAKWGKAKADSNWQELFEIANIGTAIACGYSAGLRGEELGLIRLQRSREKSKLGGKHERKPHMVLALQGRFKGVDGNKWHHIPLAIKTFSGIENERWFSRLIWVYSHYEIDSGPLLRKSPFSHEPARISDLDAFFIDALQETSAKAQESGSNTIESLDTFSVRRSLRRGSTAQARNRKVPTDIIYLHNRWRNPGVPHGGGIIEHYTDTKVAVESLLRYSEEL